ncbi:MAG: hypothetical protein ACOCMZ_02815 [Acetivibrio ethanolgignens]
MYEFFYGWYMKCQSETQTLAVIPAVHQTGKKRTCSIQIITDIEAWTVELPGDVFRQRKKSIFIGENRFGEYGIRLAVHRPELIVKGKLNFGSLSPLRYNIMRPFAFVPFMECRVFYRFQKGGYILFAFETERASFEYEYPVFFPV